LELTYGGGKTHTLVALRHLAHDPAALPELPAVDQLQDLVDALPEIVKAAAGLPLEFRLDVKLGASVKDVETSTLASLDELLRAVNPDLGLKR